jgi:hypothetical protein
LAQDSLEQADPDEMSKLSVEELGVVQRRLSAVRSSVLKLDHVMMTTIIELLLEKEKRKADQQATASVA